MHGWFSKLFRSRGASSAEDGRGQNATGNSVSLVTKPSTSESSRCSLSSSLSSPGATPRPHPALSSPQRWGREYDVLVCHSTVDSDVEEAGRLVSFLEASPRGLRCFLRQRDDCPGAAISTELCHAVQSSHVWALLITPNFLEDAWCNYMMHQALAEGPMSSRLIPLLHNLPRSQYPLELKFFFFIDLSRYPERGYTLLNKTVLKYLEDLVKKQKESDCNMDSSSNGLSGEDSSKKDQLM